jgi:MHS family proline/betaine transporter-like MFS transporter
LSGTLAAFAVFAVAFLVRPFGAVVFGHIGDRIGRRQALSIAIVLSSGATLLIGFSPGYATVGIWAPLMLVLLRCVQAFSFAGEVIGAMAYVVEFSPRNKSGLAGGVVLATAALGAVAATGVALGLQMIIGAAATEMWGWRLAFVCAGPLGIVGLYLRTRLDDTPVFREIAARHQLARVPILDVIQTQRMPMFILVALVTIQTVASYFLIAFFIAYLTEVVHVDRGVALATNLVGLLVYFVFSPVWGSISDHVGRKPVVLFGLAVIGLGTIPAFLLLEQGSWYSLAAGQGLIGFGLAALASANSLLLLELFPDHLRCSGGSVAYNIAQVIFGGTAPLVAMGLISLTGAALAPAIYLTVLTLLAALVAIVFLFRKRSASKTSGGGTKLNQVQLVCLTGRSTNEQ